MHKTFVGENWAKSFNIKSAQALWPSSFTFRDLLYRHVSQISTEFYTTVVDWALAMCQAWSQARRIPRYMKQSHCVILQCELQWNLEISLQRWKQWGLERRVSFPGSGWAGTGTKVKHFHTSGPQPRENRNYSPKDLGAKPKVAYYKQGNIYYLFLKGHANFAFYFIYLFKHTHINCLI